jgi:hypothetical protein
MANMNLTTASNVLKVFYLPPLRRLLNNSTILWNRLERHEKFNVEGKNFTVPLHVSRHTQAGAGRAEEGTLPAKDSQGYNAAVVAAKYIYTSIQISGQVIRATKSDAGAFIRAVRSEVTGAVRDTKKSANRQAHGDGRDALAYYSTGSGTSITVDDNQGNASVYLQPKATTCDLIDVSDDSTILNNSVAVTLGAEAATNYAATLGASLSGSAADGDYFVLEDTLGNQMTGLAGIVNNANPPLGNLHGIAVASNPWWQAQVVGEDIGSTYQDLRFPLLQRVCSRIAQNSSYDKEDIKFILANHFMVDKYYELCANERRAVNVMQLDGGYEGVEFSGIPIVADVECWNNRLYFIVPEALRICRMSDFDWMDDDGAVLSRVSNTDAYEATMFHYGDLATVARNGLGVLRGINQ